MLARRGPGIGGYLLLALGIVFGILLTVTVVLTNSAPVIGILIAAIAGVLLLTRPAFNVWSVLVLGLMVNGLLVLFVPALSKASWLISGLGVLLLVNAIGMSLGRQSLPSQTPAFIKTLAVLLVYSLMVCAANGQNVVEAAAGMKRYYQVWGLLFALALLPFTQTQRTAWWKVMVVLACLQLAPALYQRLVLVPRREGMGNSVVPIDVVSGTFEASMEGGGQSAAMASLLVVMLAFVLVAWRERALPASRALPLAAWIALPLGLGETKIVVVLLPLVLLVAMWPYFRQRPVSTLLMMAAGVAATVGLALLYLNMTGKPGETLALRLDKAIAYNFGDSGYSGTFGLNRITAFGFWWREHGASDPLHTVFGHGVGSSYSGSGALVVGHLAAKYRFIDINLTTASTFLWDLGLFGLGLLYLALAQAWMALSSIARQCTRGTMAFARLQALRAAVVTFAVLTIYSNALVSSLSSGILLCLVLGGTAHWYRQVSLMPAPPSKGAARGHLAGR